MKIRLSLLIQLMHLDESVFVILAMYFRSVRGVAQMNSSFHNSFNQEIVRVTYTSVMRSAF